MALAVVLEVVEGVQEVDMALVVALKEDIALEEGSALEEDSALVVVPEEALALEGEFLALQRGVLAQEKVTVLV